MIASGYGLVEFMQFGFGDIMGASEEDFQAGIQAAKNLRESLLLAASRDTVALGRIFDEMNRHELTMTLTFALPLLVQAYTIEGIIGLLSAIVEDEELQKEMRESIKKDENPPGW